MGPGSSICVLVRSCQHCVCEPWGNSDEDTDTHQRVNDGKNLNADTCECMVTDIYTAKGKNDITR